MADPPPREHPQRPEAVYFYATTELRHRSHRPHQIDRRDANETVRMRSAELSDVVIADHRSRRTPPRTQHTPPDTCPVHHFQRGRHRLGTLRERSRLPTPQRREHLLIEPTLTRVLHPGIDHHSGSCAWPSAGTGSGTSAIPPRSFGLYRSMMKAFMVGSDATSDPAPMEQREHSEGLGT